ncbi:unnamed protein product [Didymodactylos carnosus]|uniref:DNA polymerase eta n=1 Tax=Didymodactylos carnosus TaxID=1234261 RepID=A0A814CSU8_9BILA|nr:unnamed protein product [Didymodactylos carnosus]CAF0944496.1 unnamed protein product [Didymodactylos carnosus]CAF3613574.1 unnamed protein product [Didymodactylos carnosus]CAF3720768.1 unnamed protein product [Didymodactylos carnosus]
MNRVIALIDMDCFYVQVEQQLAPEFLGKPCGVAQYYTWKGGGLIAVNYEARAFGVKRGMRGETAKELCPDFHVFHVQEVNGKACLTKYRNGSSDVFRVLNSLCKCVEKASIDEAYLDLTDDVQQLKAQKFKVDGNKLPTTHLAGYTSVTDDERRDVLRKWLGQDQDSDDQDSYDMNEDNYDLALGAYLVENIREKIKEQTGYNCSAGIARNKILAKLCCGFNKPKKQTILTPTDVDNIFEKMPLKKLQSLGGKFGEHLMEKLKVNYIGDIKKYALDELQTTLGEKEGFWLYNACRGIETGSVVNRQLCKSIGASKNFPGQTRLDTTDKVRLWLKNLAEEVVDRLEKDRIENKRRVKLLTVSFTSENDETYARSCPISEYSCEKFVNECYKLLTRFNIVKTPTNKWTPAIINLGISASKFYDCSQTTSVIELFAKQLTKQKQTTQMVNEQEIMSTTRSSETTNIEFDDDDDILNEDDDNWDCGEIFMQDAPIDEVIDQQDGIQQQSSSSITRMQRIRDDPEFRKKFPMADYEGESFFEKMRHVPVEEPRKKMVKDFTLFGAVSNGHSFFAKYKDEQEEIHKEERETIVVDEESKETIQNNIFDKPSITRLKKSEPQQFLDPYLTSTTSSTAMNYSKEDYVQCSKCLKDILCWEFSQHEDYHMAYDLHQQENKPIVTLPLIITKTTAKKKLAQKRTIQTNSTTATAHGPMDTFLKRPKL